MMLAGFGFGSEGGQLQVGEVAREAGILQDLPQPLLLCVLFVTQWAYMYLLAASPCTYALCCKCLAPVVMSCQTGLCFGPCVMMTQSALELEHGMNGGGHHQAAFGHWHLRGRLQQVLPHQVYMNGTSGPPGIFRGILSTSQQRACLPAIIMAACTAGRGTATGRPSFSLRAPFSVRSSNKPPVSFGFVACPGPSSCQNSSKLPVRGCPASARSRAETVRCKAVAVSGKQGAEWRSPHGITWGRLRLPKCIAACETRCSGSAAADHGKDEGLAATLILGALFAGWYSANIGFNM